MMRKMQQRYKRDPIATNGTRLEISDRDLSIMIASWIWGLARKRELSAGD
jgi:hypothetical protein